MTETRKKSFLSIILIFIIAFLLFGCEQNEDDKKYTVDDLDTNITDSLKLETPFANQYFVIKGIEEVTLLRHIDGDTSHFLDKQNNTIKLRYLGVNTPESTANIAPWGKQASLFVKTKLLNAYSIVIEAEGVGSAPEVDTTGERYLGYVWYKPSKDADYRLLNLEIIENCFSYFTGNSENLKYGEKMALASSEKGKMKLRVFGEEDPNFDYDTTVREITIAELRNNYSNYSTGTKLKIEARVIRLVGKSLYIEDIKDTIDKDTKVSSKSGIFLYHSFATIGSVKPGEIIQFQCQASDDEAYGMQLVNPSKVRTIEPTSEYTIREIDSEVTSLKDYEGFVVKIKNFKVTKISSQNEKGAYTIYGTMESGAEIQIRIDADVSSKLYYDYVVKGELYDVIGGVGKYINPYENNKVYYQIMLGNIKDDGQNDFKKVND